MKKKELLKLIRDLQERVIKLEESSKQQVWISTPSSPPIFQPYISLPSVWSDVCFDGLQHDYPSPWSATVPPSCKKCGKAAAPLTVTCTTSGNVWTTGRTCSLCNGGKCTCVTGQVDDMIGRDSWKASVLKSDS